MKQVKRQKSAPNLPVARTISYEDYLKWLGKARPQTLQDVCNQISENPYLMLLQSGSAKAVTARNARPSEQPSMHKTVSLEEQEGAKTWLGGSNTVQGDSGAFLGHRNKDYAAGSARSAGPAYPSRCYKNGLPGNPYTRVGGSIGSISKKTAKCTEVQKILIEEALAGYQMFYSSQHVERMRLQMRIAERDLTIEDLKVRLSIAEGQGSAS